MSEGSVEDLTFGPPVVRHLGAAYDHHVSTWPSWRPRRRKAGNSRDAKTWASFSIAQVLRDYVVFDATCLDRLLTALRKAGVAETSKVGLTAQTELDD